MFIEISFKLILIGTDANERLASDELAPKATAADMSSPLGSDADSAKALETARRRVVTG